MAAKSGVEVGVSRNCPANVGEVAQAKDRFRNIKIALSAPIKVNRLMIHGF